MASGVIPNKTPWPTQHNNNSRNTKAVQPNRTLRKYSTEPQPLLRAQKPHILTTALLQTPPNHSRPISSRGTKPPASARLLRAIGPLSTHLCAVRKVPKLGLPQAERVGVLEGVPHLEAEHAELRQDGVPHRELRLKSSGFIGKVAGGVVTDRRQAEKKSMKEK